MRILARPAFSNRAHNAYNSELYGALQKLGHQVIEYAPWRILGRYDVVHVHWPESSYKHNWIGAVLTSGSLILALAFLRLRGVKILWTAHNLRAHGRKFPRTEEWMWRCFTHLLDGFFCLTADSEKAVRERFPKLLHKPCFVVPHGHYRNAYEAGPGRTEARQALNIPMDSPTLLFIGQILSYKNVPALIQAFTQISDPKARLIIAGKPQNSEIRTQITQLAQNDSRIHIELSFIPDDQLGRYVHAADLVALPYREILNSGSALLALSFDRPVLLPSQGSYTDLLSRVGPDWVRSFDGDLDTHQLAQALTWAIASQRPDTANLSALDWEVLAQETHASYLNATP